MAIYDYLPMFNYIEPNNLKGLQPGFVVAQVEAVSADLLDDKGMFENGKICALEMVEGVLTIVPATASHKTVFIHYTEPLNTVYNSDKFFAVDPAQECPRLVQLIAGDEWMSTDATIALEGRIAKVTDTKGWYSVTKMANGDNGHHYVFLG